MQQMEHAGMGIIGGAENLLRFAKWVGPPDVADFQDRDQHALGIAQCYPATVPDLASERLGHVQGDRDRPQDPVAQPHFRDHPVVVGLVQKAVQRREPAVQQ